MYIESSLYPGGGGVLCSSKQHVCTPSKYSARLRGMPVGLMKTNLFDLSCSVSLSSSGRKCSVGSRGGLPICG